MRTEIIDAVETLRENRADSVEQALVQLQGVILSFSMKVCGNREDAEDTMQETLLQAASQLPHFDRSEALALWLYKVARTRCLMSRRKSKFAPKQTAVRREDVRAELFRKPRQHRRTGFDYAPRNLVSIDDKRT